MIFKLTVLFAKMDKIFIERKKTLKIYWKKYCRRQGKVGEFGQYGKVGTMCTSCILSWSIFTPEWNIKYIVFYFQLLIWFKEHGERPIYDSWKLDVLCKYILRTNCTFCVNIFKMTNRQHSSNNIVFIHWKTGVSSC